MLNRRLILVLALAFSAWCLVQAIAEDKSIVVASTTSTEDSGLFAHLLPLFKANTGSRFV